jgi:S-DNA-T family DNA segregation ATPase FtsK/SpoIIIE
MANRLKTKQPPPPDPEVLTEDKEEEVSVTEVVKDERTSKIFGSAILLVCLFLFVAFSSYLFTWQEDQDKVFGMGAKMLLADDVRVNNLLGVLGAYVSHSIFYYGFGLASYIFCVFFFVLGVNLVFGKQVFNLLRNLKYILVGVFILSVSFAFLTDSHPFPWGGATGEYVAGWMVKVIGNFGTGAIIAFAIFSYIIWRFNPKFELPKWEKAPLNNEDGAWHEEKNDISAVNLTTYNSTDNLDPIEKIIPTVPPTSSNRLKSDQGAVTVIMPDNNEDINNPLLHMEVKEKDVESDIIEDELIVQQEDHLVEHEQEFEEDFEIEEDLENEEIEDSEDETDVMELEIQPAVVEEKTASKAVGAIGTDYDPSLELRNYKFPTLDLLESHGSEKIVHDPAELETHKNQIIATLKNYDISIQRISATIGPTVTLYEIVPAPGVRISRIKNLEDDIALSLSALGIRIIAPIPGKGTIGIEVPNIRKSVVSMKTLLASEKFQQSGFSLPIAIGKKIDNEHFIVDLATMPHLLMAGATGQGKSVGINTVLVSLLYKKHPSQLKLVLVDPKKVELSLYRLIEKHFLAKLPGEEEAIITDTKKVIHTLNALCIEMDTRYDLLKEAGCRNIREYNEKFIARKLNPEKGHQYLPFIVLVVDEFADLIMTAGKEVETPIARLAQLARAVGIHLIIATQRPSVNIITGTIKANFPARIAFKVSSKIDSRTILDAGGAEQLIGKGDMLISYNGEITRLQCAFVDTPEVDRICDFIGSQHGYPQAFLLPEYQDEKEMEGRDFDASDRDTLFADAARLIVASQMGSTSLLQRKMKLGYNRAGRLMDQLEAAGIVGPSAGSKAREVLYKSMSELEEYLDNLG